MYTKKRWFNGLDVYTWENTRKLKIYWGGPFSCGGHTSR